MSTTNTSGRRKTAVARIYLSAGSGNITVNGKDFKNYFPTLPLQYIVTQSLEVAGAAGNFDVKVNVNGKYFKNYFPALRLQYIVTQSLEGAGADGNFDVKVNVNGGGVKGQAEAVRFGIAKALVELDPEVKPALRAKGLMSRDDRMVERKKPGRRKARRRFQFSKR